MNNLRTIFWQKCSDISKESRTPNKGDALKKFRELFEPEEDFSDCANCARHSTTGNVQVSSLDSVEFGNVICSFALSLKCQVCNAETNEKMTIEW
jgi:hypothetical protein